MSDKSHDVVYTREEPIAVPRPSQERRIAIRFLDWDRCKRKLKKVKKEVPRLHLIYSFIFGIAASSLFSLITFYTNPQTQLPEWAFSLYCLTFGFSLVTASVFVYVDRKMRQEKESIVDEIIEDMESIEKTFPEI